MQRKTLNYCLAVAAIALVVYYVTQVNAVAAQSWTMRTTTDRLASLRQAHTVLLAQEAALEDRQTLATLAAQEGMVSADGVVYLVEDHSVATAMSGQAAR